MLHSHYWNNVTAVPTKNPFGDGRAAQRIARILQRVLTLEPAPAKQVMA